MLSKIALRWFRGPIQNMLMFLISLEENTQELSRKAEIDGSFFPLADEATSYLSKNRRQVQRLE